MKRRLALVASIAAIWCAQASASHPSDPSRDFIKPSNYELVQMADAIVVATPMSAEKSELYTVVSFTVDSVIKGEPIANFESIAELGEVRDQDKTDPNDLQAWSADPERCDRMTFAKNQKYVMFLEKESDGAYSRLIMRCSRTDEDDYGPDSLWVRTIKTYLNIQREHAPMAQLDVLEKLFEKKKKGSLTPSAVQEARDILRHLTLRSPWKPTPYLLATHEALERGQQPKYGLDTFALDRRGRVVDRVTGEVLNLPADLPAHRLTEAKGQVLRALSMGDHAAAAPLFEPIAASKRPAPDQLGPAIRFSAKHNQLRRAYTLVETKVANMLAVISEEDALILMSDVQDALKGDRPGEDRWRSDPYVLENWPELALRVYWQGFHLNISPLWPEDSISDIPIKNYRDRPELTRALAARYDDDVVAWAIAELNDEAIRTAWEAIPFERRMLREDPAALPLQVLVLRSNDNAGAALHAMACRPGDRRGLVIEMLGKWGDFVDFEFLGRIGALPTLEKHEREVLAVAMANLFVRDGGTSYMAAEYETLKQMIRGEPLTYVGKKLAPLECPPPSPTLAPAAAR